jgi:predicted polyphosphate/ATP-dependent NAD kinase
MRRVGFVVNPIAGMGGRVGLKGTDGKVEEARDRGAEPRAPERAKEAMAALHDADGVTIVTYGGVLGAAPAAAAGFDPEVLATPEGATAEPPATTAADTRAAVRDFVAADVDLVLFVGGDGTAVDVADALAAADATEDVPVLGVPAGVKVYSEVFGVSPRDAGRIVATYDRTEPAEVNDLDEDAYREGAVHTELHAVVTVPVAEQRQAAKQLSGGTVEGLAEGIAEAVESGVSYVLGPGSTVGAIKEALGFEGSALGVDVWRDGSVVVRDASETAILDALGERNVVIVSPIGGQGFIFGRGNQQISPAVVRQSQIMVVASRRKLESTGTLRVDSGDAELDEELRGWQRVRVGRVETRLVEVV